MCFPTLWEIINDLCPEAIKKFGVFSLMFLNLKSETKDHVVSNFILILISINNKFLGFE